MSRAERLFYVCVLLAAGAGWGLTQPLSKIAVSTGYQHFGLIFWQLLIGILALGVLILTSVFLVQPRHDGRLDAERRLTDTAS